MSRPTFAIIVSVIWSVLLIPGVLGAMLSVMFFDAPGSMNNPAAWINALVVVSFPLLCIASIAGVWLVWAVRNRQAITRSTITAQIVIACLPLLPIAYFGATMAIGTIGMLMSGQAPGLHTTIIQH